MYRPAGGCGCVRAVVYRCIVIAAYDRSLWGLAGDPSRRLWRNYRLGLESTRWLKFRKFWGLTRRRCERSAYVQASPAGAGLR